MQDFKLKTYRKLLQNLLTSGYSFQTLQDFIQQPKNRTVILRHDVDRKPGNSLKTARLEDEMGIKTTYFFRIIPHTFKPEIIKEIAGMGHEIGYHYENLTTCGGDLRLSIDDFRLNLKKLRKLYPVKTICMHGSPLSKWDNRDLWKRYSYRDFGIIAEPYFDVDFSEVLYLTDTGRRWNGYDVSVRDKVSEERGIWNEELGIRKKTMNEKLGLRFRYTWDIIEAAEKGLLPDKIMLNTHPQRWNDKPWPWVKELVGQNVKNVVKKELGIRK